MFYSYWFSGLLLMLRLGNSHHCLNNSTKRIPFHNAEQPPPPLLWALQLFSKLCSGIWRNRKGQKKTETFGWWWKKGSGWLNEHGARRKYASDIWGGVFPFRKRRQWKQEGWWCVLRTPCTCSSGQVCSLCCVWGIVNPVSHMTKLRFREGGQDHVNSKRQSWEGRLSF